MNRYYLIILTAFFLGFETIAQELSVDSILKLDKTGLVEVDRLFSKSSEIISADFLGAIEHGENAITLAKRSNDNIALAIAYQNLGQLKLLLRGMLFESAMEEFEKSSMLYKIEGTPETLGKHFLMEGYIFFKRNKLVDAQFQYEKALKQFSKLLIQDPDSPFKESMYKIFLNLGMIGSILEEDEEAMEYLNSGIDWVKKHNSDTIMPLIQLYEALEELHHINENYADSRELLEQILNIEEDYETGYYIGGILVKLKNIYILLDDMAAMKKLNKKYRSYFRQHFRNNAFSVKGNWSFNKGPRSYYNFYGINGFRKDAFDKSTPPDYKSKITVTDIMDVMTHSSIVNRSSLKESKWEIEKLKLTNKLIFPIAIASLVIAFILFYFIYTNSKLKRLNLFEQLKTRNSEMEIKIMRLGELNELLSSVKKQLKNIKGLPDSGDKEISRIINEIHNNQNKNIWSELNMYYDSGNSGFMERLSEKFPDLTSSEKRLCNLLVKGLNTKEIAEITHRNYRTIEVNRSRLRKKLNISNTNINLNDFLDSL